MSLAAPIGEELATREFEALGTSVRVVVTTGNVDTAREVLVGELAAFDQACSRFRIDSDLTAVNDRAGHGVTVGPVLLEAVEVALRAARLTDGIVDPTVGEALRVLGYDRDFRRLPERGTPLVVQAHRVPGWQCVRVDRIASTLRLPAGVRLDLGATAKALAADRAAELVRREVGGGVLVSLGGDLALAGPGPSGGWRVRATDDHRGPRDAPGQTISLSAGGLATSSSTVRRWSRGDENVHHLVDPRTGLSTEGPFRTVTVAAHSCVDANIATTAAMVLQDAAPAWLEARKLPSRLVRHDGTVVPVARWPDEGAA